MNQTYQLGPTHVYVILSHRHDAATEILATECPGDPVPSDPVPRATQCPMVPECLVTRNHSKSNKRWSQAIAAHPVELEKEIWIKKRY